MRYLIVGSFAVLLLGCAQTTARPGEPLADCSADHYNRYLWQKSSVLDGLNLPKRTRIIGPEDLVTMDHVPRRLNFAVGELGRIERVYCG